MNQSEQASPPLAGRAVALTGWFASMTQAEAALAIQAAGGHAVARPGPETDLLVVGSGAPPLGPDGRPTKALVRAEALRAEGRPIEIVSEEEWLARLELGEARAELDRLYTVGQLARITRTPEREIRAWVRAGLLRPARSVRRLGFFEFRQVASARALAALVRSGIPAARIRRSLERLGGWCETRTPLAQLEAMGARGDLLVRLDDGRLAEPSGQLRLEFDPVEEAPPRPAAATRGRATGADPGGGAAPDTWFERGVHAEEQGRLEAAAWAYQRALEEAPSAEVHFNLGNVLFLAGRKTEAARHFERATALEPDYAEAWNNLANVRAELGRPEEALRAYQRALAVAPDYADAHYNCAETLLARGQLTDALRHWRAYLALDPTSALAREVRERVAHVERELNSGERSS